MLDDNEHPVYDNRTDIDPQETISNIAGTVVSTQGKIFDIVSSVKELIAFLILGPVLGFILPIVFTSIAGGHLEGAPASIALAVGFIAGIGLPVIGIIRFIKHIKK